MGFWLQVMLVAFALYGFVSFLAGLLGRAGLFFALPWSRPFVSVLTVVRDKAHVIEGFVSRLVAPDLCSEWGVQHELVLVDNFSTDETSRILDRLARRYSHVRLVRMSDIGKVGDSAVEAGLSVCRGRVVILAGLEGSVDVAGVVQTIRCLLGERVASVGRDWARQHAAG